MSKFKNFDISKALELSRAYDKKRHYAKENLLSELISWQHFFGTTSIVGTEISLNRVYKKKTIETVLDDLGYKLISYKTTYDGVIPGKSTLFSFAPSDSNSTEGN